MSDRPLHWDIFCSVIDNYGDIGVTWRLARQLALEQAMAVRLWVDDLEAFRHIWPTVTAGSDIQWLSGVEIRRWVSPLPAVTPGDIVIEALACNLPEPFIQAMAEQSPAPLWLNLEYLSAENWVVGIHGLPSPHPRLPLTKYFFMPGYVPGTGGLTREAGLLARRDAFQRNPAEQQAFWAQFGLPPASANYLRTSCLRASVFSYESNSLASLLGALAQGDQASELMVPVGKAVAQIAAWFNAVNLQPGDSIERGSLQVHVLPMLSQMGYDHLLWACDVNFVRGEDSFVRAQFAGRPLVWQAYRQEAGAHLDKLAAFLDLYCAALPESTAQAVREFWLAWNREEAVGGYWRAFSEALPTLSVHARDWATWLSEQEDLASNLVKFINKLLELRAF